MITRVWANTKGIDTHSIYSTILTSPNMIPSLILNGTESIAIFMVKFIINALFVSILCAIGLIWRSKRQNMQPTT